MRPRQIIIVFLAALLLGCSVPDPLVNRVKVLGELRVATRNNPTTYYEDRDGFGGLEYELVTRFAASLGVKAKFIVPERLEEILPMVVRGEVHFAAAGMPVTPSRERRVRFTQEYQSITPQLVYRLGTNRRPKDISDIQNGTLEVVAGSAHEELLKTLQQTYPELEWVSQQEWGSEELLSLVVEQLIDYTVASSNEVLLSRRFHPMLKVAFDLAEPQPLAWAFPHAEDSSLYQAAQEFLSELKRTGELDQIIERYYGYVEKLDFVDTRTFRRHIVQRLPTFEPWFREAADETGIDWRLLAAIGYQESHWNPEAISPTGVKGIMMLTRATAKQLGVESRTDPRESILGGARYVRVVEAKLPDRIQEPDRIWLALAGYNIGFGHLEDARILTQRHDGDPDRWADVKKYLPLLAKKKYYSTVKHGRARGQEPVTYIDNIRSYYDLLVWEEERQITSETEEKPIVGTTPAAL
ncbi:MAG: membrane-bound lytic murein transglycosylase MltF [Gammaproteobacteria bacterium]|nr:membrane-bound lytic murein transglycosylase MltF [Gammaproteobacteria bacterium]